MITHKTIAIIPSIIPTSVGLAYVIVNPINCVVEIYELVVKTLFVSVIEFQGNVVVGGGIVGLLDKSL